MRLDKSYNIACTMSSSPLISNSISLVLSSSFGVGNSTFRTGPLNNKEIVEADTVPFGCFKKEIVIFEPQFDKKTFMGIKVFNDLNEFKQNCDLIIANRVEDGLVDVANKVFTRDIFGNN